MSYPTTMPALVSVMAWDVGDSKYSKLRVNVSSELRAEKRDYRMRREGQIKNSSRPTR
jgi:hypothetical protein